MGVTFTFKANKSKKKYIEKPDNKLIASMNLLKGEIYKIIPNTEDCYAITNFGRVMSFPRPYTNQFGTISYTPFRILSSNIDRQGYEYVVISVYNKRYTYKVHRLVAISFIDNPDNLPNVNHKDENKLNNCVDNLEWRTAKYNTNYGTCLTRRGISQQYTNKRMKPVIAYNDLEMLEFISIRSAARQLKLDQSNI